MFLNSPKQCDMEIVQIKSATNTLSAKRIGDKSKQIRSGTTRAKKWCKRGLMTLAIAESRNKKIRFTVVHFYVLNNTSNQHRIEF